MGSKTGSTRGVKFDQYAVTKLEGTEPERFMIVFANLGSFQNPVMRTTKELSENELRRELEQTGRSKPEIDALIKKAREHSSAPKLGGVGGC